VLLVLCLAVTVTLAASKPAIEKKPQGNEKKEAGDAPTVEKSKPLLTSTLFSDTYNLALDLSDMAWVLLESKIQRFETGFVIAGFGMYWPYHGAVELAKKAGKHPEFSQAEKQLSTLKLTLTAHVATVWGSVTARGDQVAELIATKFETAMPKHKGVIPHNFLDFSIFILYISFVLYVLLKCVRFVLRIVFGIFCCVCCCGCLRRGNKTDAKSKGKETAGKAPAGKAGKVSGGKK